MKIKSILTISLILNALALGVCVKLMPVKYVTESANRSLEVPPPASTLPVVQAPSFSWTQIQSEDNATLITNLRRIGCPEQTIRWIITGKLDDFYAEKSRTLPHSISTEEDLKKLEQYENRMLSNLLSSPTPQMSTKEVPQNRMENSGTTAQEGESLQGESNSVLKEEPIQLPVAFQNVNPAEVQLDPLQQGAVAQVQQQFLDAVGGSNQNPNDPAYRQRWVKAQPQYDEQLMIKLGTEAYNLYQINAVQQAIKAGH